MMQVPVLRRALLTIGRVLPQVSAWGEHDEYEPTRVEVQVTMCLSFAEVLGALTFTPGVILTPEELADDDDVRESFRYAVITEGVGEVPGQRARLALNALHGRVSGPDVPPVAYMRQAAAAVTRVFGLADDSATATCLVASSREPRRMGAFGDER